MVSIQRFQGEIMCDTPEQRSSVKCHQGKLKDQLSSPAGIKVIICVWSESFIFGTRGPQVQQTHYLMQTF